MEPFLDKVGAHLDSYCVSAFTSLQMIRDNNKPIAIMAVKEGSFH